MVDAPSKSHQVQINSKVAILYIIHIPFIAMHNIVNSIDFICSHFNRTAVTTLKNGDTPSKEVEDCTKQMFLLWLFKANSL